MSSAILGRMGSRACFGIKGAQHCGRRASARRASGLNLVSAAITLWNTVYLCRAADHLRRHGRDIDDTLLSHAAPLGWEHISLTGDYLWGDMKLPEDEFRPLRTQNRQSEA